MKTLFGSTGCVLFSLALSLGACVRDQSLGAAADTDGGIDAQPQTDANLPIDAQPQTDANLPIDAQPQTDANLPIDAQPQTDANLPDANIPIDATTDVPTTVTCVENGVTYQPGDIIPRAGGACLVTCLCLPDGTVGRCTGACGPDGPTP